MATIKKCNIQYEQVEQGINQVVTSADPLRAESLQKLQRVRMVKAKNLKREQIRLTEKLGKDNPRIQAMQTKIIANNELVRNLKVETLRAKTEAPVVESDSWVVHGRVLNNQLDPVVRVKAALYDKSGCIVEACGSEDTDKTGYFKLVMKNVADDTAGRTEKNEPEAAFLYVLDRNNVVVHRDKRPLPVKAGQVQYLEVVLDDEDVGHPPQPKTRYLGNSNSKELHDLKNQKAACQIDEIRPDHRYNFKTQKEALAMGYDFCAYCFGKDKSKR